MKSSGVPRDGVQNRSPDRPLRERVQWAAGAARTVMRCPSLYSVVIESGGPDDSVETAQCGFQHARRSWFGRPLLDVCQVRVAASPDSARVTSYGTFRRDQYRQMASIKEFPFPPRPLELSEMGLEPADARARLKELVPGGARGSSDEPACLGLALTIYAERLAWHGTVDVRETGVHSVILDAANGDVLLHKFDRYHRK